MKRALALLALAFLAAPASGAVRATDYWRPTAEQVAKVERKLVLPDGAAPLTAYARYYAGVPPRGSHRITGMLLLSRRVPQYPEFDVQAGVVIVDKPRDWPTVNDGGCGVIHFTYSLASDEVLEIRCNGVA